MIREQRDRAKQHGDQSQEFHGGHGGDMAFGIKRDEAVMVRRPGVVVDQFVERRAGGEGGITEQQDNQETS